ncbi:MAG TPA: hypothetical protein VE934_06740 [Polaromonas sp.]|uniref:hypothetical protein n=1 Tax=Polaromonas sp. TaxID=1869339 RepID=UPI002D51BC4B|nr:hypothetical protein [Polaromonas sp.]HYW56637.1 hypothetical protein [Polaromonas sp.]
MTAPGPDPAGQASVWSSWVALLASSGTLICCALPALLVAVGAGAALSSLIAVMPGLVWISEYKLEIFAAAGAMLALGGALQWKNRFAPCPVDPALRQACLSTRKNSARVYTVSVVLYAMGGWFAFVQPWLQEA